MADQDFKINIKTVADTTGIQITKQQLASLQESAAKGNADAIRSLGRLEGAQLAANRAGASSGGGMGLGSAAGVATIISLVTAGIAKWKEFIDEQNKFEASVTRATEKMREEALEVAKIKDLDFSEGLNASASSAAELEANVGRLTQKIAGLQAEQKALNPFSQSKEWKELRTEIDAYGRQLDGLRSKIKRQRDEEISGLRDKKNAMEQAAGGLSPQAKAVVQNEQAARQATAEGRSRDADLFSKAAEDFKRSMTEAQRAELENFRHILTDSKDTQTAREIQNLKAYMQSVWGQ